MAFFELNSEITIGGYTFTGVHEVRIMRGIHSYYDRAFIKLPSIGSIKEGNSVKTGVTVGSLFADGNPVLIKLGYDGELIEEFRGFVRRRNLAMPLEIECEGYARQLRLNVRMTTKQAKDIKVKALLKEMCQGTDISVQCPVDFTLKGLRLADVDGIKVLDHIKRCSAGALNLFFIEPKTLWCGLPYSPYVAGASVFNLPTVNYRLGWNVVKDNALRERVPTEHVQVILNGVTISGDGVRTASKDKQAKRREKFYLNHVAEESVLKQFAHEMMLQRNYTGYDGYINAFLQPYCAPGYSAKIVDDRYKERTGVYLVESTEVTFGVRGARRKVGIGPKIG